MQPPNPHFTASALRTLGFSETSKRLSIKDRETRKKKVHDGRKKNKRLAKKDVTWKSSEDAGDSFYNHTDDICIEGVKKEGGMPNAMPFKDLIIAEMTQAKRTVS